MIYSLKHSLILFYVCNAVLCSQEKDVTTIKAAVSSRDRAEAARKVRAELQEDRQSQVRIAEYTNRMKEIQRSIVCVLSFE